MKIAMFLFLVSALGLMFSCDSGGDGASQSTNSNINTSCTQETDCVVIYDCCGYPTKAVNVNSQSIAQPDCASNAGCEDQSNTPYVISCLDQVCLLTVADSSP